MPYALFQGGRRRRRWKGPLAFAASAAVLVYLLAPGGEESPRAPARAQTPLATVGPAPLAGGGTAPSPLAVRLEEGADPVRIRFRRPPRAALLFDLETGRVLWRRNPTRVLPIASLTKIMTALVVDERVPGRATARISRRALRYRGSAVGLLPRGRRVGVSALLHGLLLPSGNDAAIALAERAAGREAQFVALMNAKAQAMGLACTRFASASGIVDRGNQSCAADLAAMTRALLRVPRLARIVRRREAVLRFPIKGGRLYLYNNNPLLRAGYPGVTGVKTGYTEAAGRCLVVTARRRGVHLGVVLLDAADPGRMARQLLDRGFRAVR